MTRSTKPNLVATAITVIGAPRARVWNALVDPAAIKAYMFGTTVTSDFRPGSAITWKGEWQGKAYEDKGTILRAERERLLSYTHFSPLAGAPDVPESYHTVTITLADANGATRVTLEQDNNATSQEAEHSRKNWEGMLGALKKYVEGRKGST